MHLAAAVEFHQIGQFGAQHNAVSGFQPHRREVTAQ